MSDAFKNRWRKPRSRPSEGPGRGKQREQRRKSALGLFLAGWLQAHGRAAVGALGRLFRTRLASGMTAAVLGIALALPSAFLLLLQTMEQATEGWDGGATISLYIAPDVTDAVYRELAADLLGRERIRSTDVVSPEQGMAEFRAQSGMSEALDLLDENPLPPVIVVVPLASLDAGELQALSHELGGLASVDSARLDLEWVQRLHAIMELLRRVIWLVAGLLAVTVILVVGNTIRLAIENRRDEIVITKLIGGTDAFIRRPFLYEGVWFGAFGGLFAGLLVQTVGIVLARPAADLARFYQSGPLLSGLGFGGMGLVIAAGVALGLAGSWLAVGRHLAAIEPH